MKLAGIDIAVFALYFVAVVVLAVLATRATVGTKRDYFLAGDKLPWWMVGGSIIASNISSHHFIGVIGTAYKIGFVAMTIEWGAILLGFNALLWVFLPFYLRNGFYTMPEFLKRRFGDSARGVYALLILIIYVFVEIAAVLYFGATALNTLFGINILGCIIILAVFTGIYTVAGGLRAVVWTEMLQLIVLLIGGITLSVMTLDKVGGWSWVAESSKTWHLILPANDPDFPWTMYLGGLTCISIFYCAANQFIVQRTLAARDEWHARMGIVFSDYLKFLMPLLIVVPGLAARQLFPDLKQPDQAFPLLVETLLPRGMVGLVMAGLIAAMMGHLSGAINSCTTIASIDFYLPYINKTATERQTVFFGRITGVVIVLAGIALSVVLMSYRDMPVFLILLNAYGYVTPGIATMFLLGIFWKRATHAGALAAGLLTIPLSAAINGLVPGMPFLNRAGIVFWACMGIAVAVSLVTKQKPAAEIEGLIWTPESMKLPEGMRERMRGLRSPTLWWAIIMLVLAFFFIRFH